ncbi:hypothetical protein [Aminobacter sp. BE322]|uniref:hypothetical protein n=1 Tax=unclassified Aminobacter TaxID=2644704 RepID=UPI003D1A62A8
MKRSRYDENYVREILAGVSPAATLDRRVFRYECQKDINAGYVAEVDEAEYRLFDRGAKLQS